MFIANGFKTQSKQKLHSCGSRLKVSSSRNFSAHHHNPTYKKELAANLPMGDEKVHEATRILCKGQPAMHCISGESSLHDYCVAWKQINLSASSNNSALCIREWASDLNEIAIGLVTVKSRLMAAWRCERCSKCFFERVHFRIFGRGPNTSACPFCIRKNNITNTHPYLASEYVGPSYDLQGERYLLSVAQITAYDLLRCQWRCGSCGNLWLSAVSQRSSGEKSSLCDTCSVMFGDSRSSSRAMVNPDSLSGESLTDKVAKPCASARADSLFDCFPGLLRELSKKRHGQLRINQMKNISVHSHERLHWICKKCDREYLASPYERSFASRKYSRVAKAKPTSQCLQRHVIKDANVYQALPTCCPKCIWIDHEANDLKVRLQSIESNSSMEIQVPRRSRQVPSRMNSSCFLYGESTRLSDNDLIN